MSALPRLRRPLLATAVALALVLTACGDDGESTEAVESSTTSTSEAAESTEGPTSTSADDGSETTVDDGDDEGGDVGDPDEPTDGQDSSELTDVLLTLDDLPEGFTAEESDPLTDEGNDEGLCAGDAVGTFPEPIEEVGRDFENEDETFLMGSQAARFSPEDAEAVLQLYRDEVARCTAQDPNISITEIPGVGDEAVSVVVAAEGETYASALRAARVGDVILFVGMFGDPTGLVDGDALLGVTAERAASL